MIRTDRAMAHDKLDQILNIRDRNRPGFQTDWRATRIGGHPYAHANDVWSKLEPGDPSPRTLVDDLHLFEDREETPERRDRVEGRNRKFGIMKGNLSVAMDSLDGQPTSVLADFVEKRLQGRELNRHQAGYVLGLRYYLSDKSSIGECNMATVRGLLKGLAAV